MPKDQESLEESRKIRQMLIDKWGLIPGSVIDADWSERASDDTITTNDMKRASGYDTNNTFALSGTGSTGGAMSRFPQNVCRWAISFWAPEKLESSGYFGNYLPTVLDPFAGHNSRMESTFLSNRNYVGSDICHEFIEHNRKVLARLQEHNKSALIPVDSQVILHEIDSRNLSSKVAPESMDFCITSPPFYNVEIYGPEAEQLSNCPTYEDFLKDLQIIANACYLALKSGAYCVWEFNDFRRDNRFFTYHADGLNLFRQAGFVIKDIVIVNYNASFYKAFLSFIEHLKVTAKQHSYLIVGQKPASVKPKYVETRERLVAEAQRYRKETGQLGFLIDN